MSTSERICHCGVARRPDARFCTGCGASFGGESVLLGTSSTSTRLVIGVGAEGGEPDADAASLGGGVDRRWMALAGAVFAAVIAWSVVSGGSSETPAVDGRAQSPSTTQPTTRVTTTTIPPMTRPSIAEPRRIDPTTTEPAASTTSVIGGGDPLLGEVTGFRLLIGRSYERPAVLDLDTGQLTLPPDGLPGFSPTMASGQWLVGRRNDRLVSVPAADLGAEPIELLAGEPQLYVDLAAMPPRHDATAWVMTYSEASTYVLVDLATGDAIETVPAVGDPFNGHAWIVPGAPGDPYLATPSGGGIYESVGEGYRQVAEGRLIVADDRRVLVASCDERLTCRRQWLDRETWQPVDLFLPAEDVGDLRFVNGTDWLVEYRFQVDASPPALLNVVTGTRRALEIDPFDVNGGPPPISPDGRWLAADFGRDLVIIELETGVEHTIPNLDAQYATLLFTTADVGYAPPPSE